MARTLVWTLAVVAFGLAAVESGNGAKPAPGAVPPAPGPERVSGASEPVLASEIERYGITWKLGERVPVGRFVNGDPYVVGPVTVVSVDPPPTAERNGSVLNPPPDPGRSGFDSRSPGGRFDPKLRAAFPCRMQPGDCLVSTISVGRIGEVRAQLRPSDEAQSPVLSASILTCLDEAAPPDAFRPSYADRGQKIFLAHTLRRDLLPRLPRVQGDDGEGGWTSRADPEEWAKRFERPWLDICTFGFDAPVQYMPHYGREIGRAVGIASLILCLDFDSAEKERLLVGFVQYGIDLWGIVRSGHPGWPAHGGHGSGRKWPILFAGILLGDPEMQSPSKTCPGVRFGEDMQTMRGKGWAGATALYAGHMGEDGEKHEKGWGSYEHLPPAKWLSPIGEDYRRCCTSIAWAGQALAARILGAEKVWGHDVFFEYVDRWMEEDDGDAVRVLREQTGKDYSADWMRQGQAWDPLVKALWKRYRHDLPKAALAPTSAR
jgi:hypothetical protein